MKVSKNYSLFSFFSLLSLVIVLLSSSGCNKEMEPIVLTGNWDLDTVGVMVYIVYNPNVANEHPATVKFLGNNLQTIRRELMKPLKITFKTPNVAEFIYSGNIPVQGTFVQQTGFFTITNIMFPGGIVGASDNLRMELYYNREYLMSILNNLITDEDDSPEIYDRLIEKFEGVSSYKKGF